MGRFWNDSERIFDGFCDDFLRNLERETMIRATMGISMDGWMDGWMDLQTSGEVYLVQNLTSKLILRSGHGSSKTVQS